MLSKLVEGTRDTYHNGGRSWPLWRRLRALYPYPQGETRCDRVEDEADLIRAVAYFDQVGWRRATTALMGGYSFIVRASEYLDQLYRMGSLARLVRGVDIQGRAIWRSEEQLENRIQGGVSYLIRDGPG